MKPNLPVAQDEYENPTEEDLNRVYHVPIQPVSGETAETESDRLFQHMTEMTILTVQLIVEFSKHLPGFQTLCREDQVCRANGAMADQVTIAEFLRIILLSRVETKVLTLPWIKAN